jgi:uncharacterized protein (DUF305 family)
MNAPATGDADRDFATAMIGHHQGAIDMAHILLQYGRDPELRAMAEDVIKYQDVSPGLYDIWEEQFTTTD